MNKKIEINTQRDQNQKQQTNLFYNGCNTFEKAKKYILETHNPDEKLSHIFLIGDKKYILENQMDFEIINKLTVTHDAKIEIRNKNIDEQFENRKQIHQNQQIIQQHQTIKQENKNNLQLQQIDDDQRIIYSTPCEQFFSHKNILICPCSTEKKQENCMFCNNQKQIQYKQYQQELDQAMKDFLINNLYKLEQFITEKFNLKYDQMNSYLQWISFHNELMDFQNLKSFNFFCIKCKSGCSKQVIVYVKQQKFPQSAVCMNCYDNLNTEEKKKYHCLGEVQLSQPPNIMERINSKGN